MDFIKKYKKDIAITLAVFLTGLLAVMGYHWSEVAKTPFFASFWNVLCVLAWVAALGSWFILWKRDRSSAKKGR